MFWTELLTVALLHLLAVISPGPDFIMQIRNTLTYSRKVGIFTALGFALGNQVHVTYSLLGIGLLISQSIVLFNIIKIAGAAYLIYIGYKSLRAKKSDTVIEIDSTEQTMSPWRAVRTGFLTNVLNPKATLFFVSLFTLVINPTTPKWAQFIYGLETSIATFVWFSIVAILISHPRIQGKFTKVQHILTKVMGALLIGLGIKVATSAHN